MSEHFFNKPSLRKVPPEQDILQRASLKGRQYTWTTPSGLASGIRSRLRLFKSVRLSRLPYPAANLPAIAKGPQGPAGVTTRPAHECVGDSFK